MNNVEIFEQLLEPNSSGFCGKLAIFRGGLNTDNPTEVLNVAIKKYVGFDEYNDFIEISCVNPWVRVILSNINKIDGFTSFDNQRLSVLTNMQIYQCNISRMSILHRTDAVDSHTMKDILSMRNVICVNAPTFGILKDGSVVTKENFSDDAECLCAKTQRYKTFESMREHVKIITKNFDCKIYIFLCQKLDTGEYLLRYAYKMDPEQRSEYENYINCTTTCEHNS